MNIEKNSTRYLLSLVVGIMSYCALSLEIILTRIFSILYTYNYVFMIVSLTVLGMGLGGAWVMYLLDQSEKKDDHIPSTLWLFNTACFGISVIMLMLICISNFTSLLVVVVIAMLPFLFAGSAIAFVFAQYPTKSTTIYAVDLAGAALAAVSMIWILDKFSATQALLIPTFLSFCAFIITQSIVASPQLRWLKNTILTVFALGLISGILINILYDPFIPIGNDPDKDMSRILMDKTTYDARVIESHSSAFGRTDLVEIGTRPDEMQIFVDGAAGSTMYAFDKNFEHFSYKLTQFKQAYTGYFPFLFKKQDTLDRVLVIGAGAGREVLIALSLGVKNITAVEVNPDIVSIVRKYKDYNGGIYTDFPNVKVVVDEGRHFLRSSKEQYDAIVLALPVTKSSRSYQGFALTENSLITVESIDDYLQHLTPNGEFIMVAHNNAQIARLVLTTIQSFSRKNVSQEIAMKYMYTVGSNQFPVFVLRKTPFTLQESEILYKAALLLGYDVGYTYIPGHPTRYPKPDAQYYAALAVGEITPGLFQNTYQYKIAPATDDSPFFYWIYKRLPAQFIFALCIALLILLILLILPGVSLQLKKQFRWTQGYNFVWVATFLGIGFMLVEVPLIQKNAMLIGNPVLAFSLSLMTLLFGMSCGSFLTGKLLAKKPEIRIGITIGACLVVGSWIGLAASLQAQLIHHFLAANITVRITLSAVIFLITGIFMGVPFPMLLRFSHASSFIAWCYAANGVGGVIGSILSLIIGMFMGYSYALGLASAIYFSIGCFLYLLFSHHSQSTLYSLPE